MKLRKIAKTEGHTSESRYLLC